MKCNDFVLPNGEGNHKSMKNKTYVIMSIFYSLLYMASGSFLSYIGLYYAEIGLDNGQIGLISSIMAGIGILSQPIIGTISDKSTKKNRVLRFTLLFCTLSTLLIPFAKKDFLLVTITISIFSIFNNSIAPLGDTITLELAKRDGFQFSKVRMAGSLGYAIMAAVAGKIFSIDIMYLFPVYFVLRALAYGTSYFIPPVSGYKFSEIKVSFKELFRDKKLNLLYFYIFILSCTQGFFYSFNAIYSKQVGITTDIIGIGVMIGSFSQFPFMLYFDKIYKKFGIFKILVISGLAYAIRWALYATALNSKTILLLWCIHGFNYIMMYLCITEYVHLNVPKELHTRGQMMNTIILFGISNIIGVYLGGVISNYTGIGPVFMYSAVACLLAVIIFIFLAKRFGFTKKAEIQNIVDGKI